MVCPIRSKRKGTPKRYPLPFGTRTVPKGSGYLFVLSFFLVRLCFANTESLLIKIRDAAQRSSLDPKLVQAVIKVESNFRPDATSAKGAMGLMQVMPQTAERCGIVDPYHPLDNLMGACECLRELINRYRGDLRLALAAYNAGPRNIDKYHGIPPFRETQAYVKRVLEIYSELKQRRS